MLPYSDTTQVQSLQDLQYKDIYLSIGAMSAFPIATTIANTTATSINGNTSLEFLESNTYISNYNGVVCGFSQRTLPGVNVGYTIGAGTQILILSLPGTAGLGTTKKYDLGGLRSVLDGSSTLTQLFGTGPSQSNSNNFTYFVNFTLYIGLAALAPNSSFAVYICEDPNDNPSFTLANNIGVLYINQGSTNAPVMGTLTAKSNRYLISNNPNVARFTVWVRPLSGSGITGAVWQESYLKSEIYLQPRDNYIF